MKELKLSVWGAKAQKNSSRICGLRINENNIQVTIVVNAKNIVTFHTIGVEFFDTSAKVPGVKNLHPSECYEII